MLGYLNKVTPIPIWTFYNWEGLQDQGQKFEILEREDVRIGQILLKLCFSKETMKEVIDIHTIEEKKAGLEKRKI